MPSAHEQEPQSGFPEPAGEDPGDRSGEQDPHHALNNPAHDPDPTEWPDPYDRRSDPRDPAGSGEPPYGEAPHTSSGSQSTSEPHPAQDPEAEPWEGPKRDKVDE